MLVYASYLPTPEVYGNATVVPIGKVPATFTPEALAENTKTLFEELVKVALPGVIACVPTTLRASLVQVAVISSIVPIIPVTGKVIVPVEPDIILVVAGEGVPTVSPELPVSSRFAVALVQETLLNELFVIVITMFLVVDAPHIQVPVKAIVAETPPELLEPPLEVSPTALQALPE